MTANDTFGTDVQEIPPYQPAVAWLNEVLPHAVRGATAVPIKRSSTPATIYRLRVDTLAGEAHSYIIKRIGPNWPDDPWGHEREVRYYQSIIPCLGLPHIPVFFAGKEPNSEYQIVLMADVQHDYRFPVPTHRWSMPEIRRILTTYAHFHKVGSSCVPHQRQWLMPRHEERVQKTAAQLTPMIAELSERGVFPALPRFSSLLTWLLRDMKQRLQEPGTLLHNDVFPPNIALPWQNGSPVLLIDWEMLGWGMPEMDLAFMFLQPFGSHRQLDRRQALAHYWQEVARLGGEVLPLQERQERQRYADALWACWLIPVAHQMALAPFPPGKMQRIYWDEMHQVLGAKLSDLLQQDW